MSVQPDQVIVPLPSVCDASAATPLAAALLSRRGRSVSIDASSVEKLSTLALQVLISARITWKADRVAFSIGRSSPVFRQTVDALGLQALLRKSED